MASYSLLLSILALGVSGKPLARLPLVSGVAGRSVVLSCPLTSSSLVVWVRGQRVLYAGGLRVVQDPRMRVEDTSLEVEEKDSGVYRCQVEEEGRLRVVQDPR